MFEICGAGRIIDHVMHEDGRYHLVLHGLARVRILSELPPTGPYRIVQAELLADLATEPRLCTGLETKIRALWQGLAPTLPPDTRDLAEATRGATTASAFSDRLGALLAGDAELSLRLLGERDPCTRLQLIAERLQVMTESLAPASARATLN